MEESKIIINNISNGQMNNAYGNSTINATQIYNYGKDDEFQNLINDIDKATEGIREEDKEVIADAINMVKEERDKDKPNKTRLRSCITIVSSVINTINGFPTAVDKLNKLINYITLKFKL